MNNFVDEWALVGVKPESPEPKPLDFSKVFKSDKLAINAEIVNSPDPLKFEALDLTAPRGGFYVSEKSQSQINHLNNILRNDVAKYFSENPSPAGRPEAEKARLVKECKSPTRNTRSIENALKAQSLAGFYGYLNRRGENTQDKKQTLITSHAPIDAGTTKAFVNDAGVVDFDTGEILPAFTNKTAIAQLSKREWSNEYRIRVTTDTSPASPPPQQAGDRVTKFLTTKAAKNILDSGAYVSAVRGGYTTFLTLTFNADARARINSGESTIGKECSRFFDAAQKMYQRGWIADKTVIETKPRNNELFSNNNFDCVANDEEIIEASGDKLDYLWVAEAPSKTTIIETRGDFDCVDVSPNPHCHVLMRWNVEPHLFRAWAKRLESIWGHGFAKLERIKNVDAASGYMLKALGYMLKGEEQSDQGTIKGNRYNISKTARALPWENIANFHAEHMASMIGEIKAKLERKAKPTCFAIGKEKEKLNKAIRDKAFLKNTGKQTFSVDARIKAIEKKIQGFKSALRDKPVRANDYIINFKGSEALKTFMNWAVGVRNWSAQDAASELSPTRLNQRVLTAAVAGTKKTFSRVRNRFLELEQYWKAQLATVLPPEKNSDELNKSAFFDFLEYEKSALMVA